LTLRRHEHTENLSRIETHETEKREGERERRGQRERERERERVREL